MYPLVKEELRTLVETMLLGQAEGKSVRSIAFALGKGDKKSMLRYQNKYRGLLRSNPGILKPCFWNCKSGENQRGCELHQKEGGIAPASSRRWQNWRIISPSLAKTARQCSMASTILFPLRPCKRRGAGDQTAFRAGCAVCAQPGVGAPAFCTPRTEQGCVFRRINPAKFAIIIKK